MMIIVIITRPPPSSLSDQLLCTFALIRLSVDHPATAHLVQLTQCVTAIIVIITGMVIVVIIVMITTMAISIVVVNMTK